jgi:1,2-phenylacetyl-CoA epoxidase catalytic subunit
MTFSLASLEPAVRQSLRDELLAIADTKLVLGNWYAVCIMNGRSLPDFAALTAMTGVTYGHTRALYQYLVNFGTDYATLERGRGPGDIRSMNLLDVAPKGWEDFLAATWLAEQAAWAMLSGFLHSPDRVLAGLVEKIGQEVYFHFKYLAGWIRVVAESESARAAFVAAFAARYPVALQWFGAGGADALHAAGLRDLPVDKLRRAFAAEAAKIADVVHQPVELPDAAPTAAGWRADARRAGVLPPRLYEVVRFKDQAAAH